jgi:adenylate cyclase
MGKEIERKFLLSDSTWRDQVVESRRMRQGYLVSDEHSSVRLRVVGEQAHLNIKSGTLGVSRLEYEYPLPLQDAEEMLDRLCSGPLVEKIRHIVPGDGVEWEIDEFLGENAGLVVAEVELEDESQQFNRPEWLGKEVSMDPRYYNSCLSRTPYSSWSDDK